MLGFVFHLIWPYPHLQIANLTRNISLRLHLSKRHFNMQRKTYLFFNLNEQEYFLNAVNERGIWKFE